MAPIGGHSTPDGSPAAAPNWYDEALGTAVEQRSQDRSIEHTATAAPRVEQRADTRDVRDTVPLTEPVRPAPEYSVGPMAGRSICRNR